ncbi:DUF551 domain-containing protein [Enterobacter hormaechei]|uniref:DUF551 domain-containing protein n=1 Tax=Enterobacter hormaechei TaxID=158836 RepID=UPI001BA7D388|nr:DUF551 domain-containing protein [Enterobacter hormaechei]MBS0833657.1 DUF551 domain-containing protein [Enterobacter hormaechei]
MSNIDKRALREAAERAESDSWGYDRDEFNEALTPSTVLALLDELEAKDSMIAAQQHEIRTLLNALEGRPCPKCNDTGMADSGGTQPWGEPISVPCDCAAPPAPVSVPAAMEMDDDFDSAFEHGKAVGWNAYRAAMLQSLGNSEQLEPVTTANKLPECWVACSERMPDDEEDVLCFGQYGDNDIDEERYQFMGWLSSKGIKRVWRVSDGDSQNRRARVTHWMPLPAAPHREGENV